MCEPDPAFTWARSSLSSSTCHRRRRLRRQVLRTRRSHHHRNKRVVGLTLVEEPTSTRTLAVLSGPRTKLRRPRRPFMHRAHLRRRRTDSVMVFAVPYVCWTKIKLVGQGAQDQHARQRAGTSGTRSPGRGTAPSNIVRSPSISRSSHRSPLPPTTPAEALAQAQLLLDYPPAEDKLDQWRATIQSLIGYANGDTPRQPSASQPRQGCQARAGGDETGGGVTTVHSLPRRPRSPTRRIHVDSDSTAS